MLRLPFLFPAALCAGLLLTARPGHAQAPAYRFDLRAEKLDVPASPWQVTRVLDLRSDRSRLGTVQRGLNNQRGPVDFTQALAPELRQFIGAKAPAVAGARPVVLRVFALALAEDTRPTSEHAEAELLADFLEPLPDSTFRVLLTVGETTRRGGLDVTKFHPTNVALVLQQALRRLASVPAPAAGSGEILPLADALAGRGGLAGQRFPVQTAAEPKRGFYRSFEEFRDNAPSEPAFPFAVSHVARSGKRWAGTDEVQVNYLQTDADHPTRPVGTSGLWGLSDGRELLIVYRNRFYKLLAAPDGRSYTFTGPPQFDAAATSQVATAAMLGGALGAAIAKSGMPPVVMAPYELHLASGRVAPVNEVGTTDASGFSTLPDTAGVFIYRRPGAGPAITLTATGQPAAALQAREWTAVSWRDRRRELKLCVQLSQGAETCREFVPDFSQPTYLECVVPADGGAPELRLVSAKEGQFELKRIQRLAKAGK